jgi:putative transposase
MALDQSALLDVLDALKVADVSDRVRQAAETIYQALIEAELTDAIGAAPHERSAERCNLRNGHRVRTLTTTAGDLELRIPKLRTGSFFPSLLERRRRVEQALFAVVMEAYLHGVSTRTVDDLVKALGADTGISKSEVSRICSDLDQEVGAFRDRSLAEQHFPYVLLDATYRKARVNRRVVSQRGVAAWSSPPVSALTVGARCWASRSGTARTAHSGPRFCAVSKRAGSAESSWSSLTRTPDSSRLSRRC